MAHAALRARAAARYCGCGRFARHYVAGKLRHDPLTAALLELAAREPFGAVIDVGCGRGQFAALLLEAGLATSVLGVERNAALLADARLALQGLRFTARAQDLATDATLPAADTVLLLDVLYQLPTAAQARLLDAAARAAPRVIVRTADPARGLRAWLTRRLELFTPHAGAMVNAQGVEWIAARLTSAGLAVSVAPCAAGTPFANVLLTARQCRADRATR